MSNIYITGIAGFLGGSLAQALQARGHNVRGNDNLICPGVEVLDAQLDTKFPFSLTDCRSFEGMKLEFQSHETETLVHCAATAHEGLSVFSPSFITQNIYEASVATFSAAIAAGVKHIIYMSSMSRYGHGEPIGPPFIEDIHLPAPADPYAIAKVAAEQTLRMLCKTHPGVEWTILVPHNIIGPRQNYVDPHRNVASIMINRCLQNLPPIIYGDGTQMRCFSPISDCLDSLIKAIELKAAVGQVVNIGPGEGGEISILTLSQKIQKLTQTERLTPIYYPDRPCEVRQAFCSAEKAKKLLGYTPQQDIDQCLFEMVEYVREWKPRPFYYSFPLEIVNSLTPRTWKDKLI